MLHTVSVASDLDLHCIPDLSVQIFRVITVSSHATVVGYYISCWLAVCQSTPLYIHHTYTDNPFYTDIRYNDKIRYNDNLTVTKPSLRGNN